MTRLDLCYVENSIDEGKEMLSTDQYLVEVAELLFWQAFPALPLHYPGEANNRV